MKVFPAVLLLTILLFMAQGPRHLSASFVSEGLRKSAQTLTSAEKAQVQTNLSIPAPNASGGFTSLPLTTPIIGPSGTPIVRVLSVVGTLILANITTNSEATGDITVTGAAVGDSVSLGFSAPLPTGIVICNSWVSSVNTVSIRVRNVSGVDADPDDTTVRVTVFQF